MNGWRILVDAVGEDIDHVFLRLRQVALTSKLGKIPAWVLEQAESDNIKVLFHPLCQLIRFHYWDSSPLLAPEIHNGKKK